jgi:hypothetical protein
VRTLGVQLLERVVGVVDNRMRGGNEDHGMEPPDPYGWLEDDVEFDDPPGAADDVDDEVANDPNDHNEQQANLQDPAAEDVAPVHDPALQQPIQNQGGVPQPADYQPHYDLPKCTTPNSACVTSFHVTDMELCVQ